MPEEKVTDVERNGDISPQGASAEIDRTTHAIRRRARWQGWLFLAVGLLNFGFYVAVGSTSQNVARALSPLPFLLALMIFVFASRQPVIGRDAPRANQPIVVAGLVTAVAGLVVYQTVLPQGFTAWLVALAALMVTPFMVGAWYWLRP